MIVNLPRALRGKLGDEAGEALVSFLDQLFERESAEVLEGASQRCERRLAEETGALRQEQEAIRSEMKAGFSGLRAEFKQDVADLRSETRGALADLRAEMLASDATTRTQLIRVGQVVVLVSLLTAFRQESAPC